MVKEGFDSTVRPKIQTYEFNEGKLYLDQWASDGKPHFSRAWLGRGQAALILLTATTSLGCLMYPWEGESGKEHVFTPVRRGLAAWWEKFTALDVVDIAKAQSVGDPIVDARIAEPQPAAPAAVPKKFRDSAGM